MENNLNIKEVANKKISDKIERQLDYKNIFKFLGYGLVGVCAIYFIFTSFIGGDKKKETTQNIQKTDLDFESEGNTTNSTSYSEQDREAKTTYAASEDDLIAENEEEEMSYEELTSSNDYQEPELSPTEQFLKEQELLRLQRKYEARMSPFKTSSIKVDNGSSLNTSSNTSNSSSPYANEYDYIMAGIEASGTNNPNLQKQKKQWLKEAAARNFVSKDRLISSISRYEVKAGTYIPIISTFELISSLPGKVTAIVSQNIYDSLTGNYLVIPMGTKLFGEYNSELSWGQERVQVKFTRMTLPNGKSLELNNVIGGSELGQSGMTGKVDMKLGKVVGSVVMAAFLGGANGVLTNNGSYSNDKNAALAKAGEESGGQVIEIANNYAEKILNVEPTITVPLGKRGTLILTEDLILELYNENINYLSE